MAATEVHVREEMRGRTATSIASSTAKDREDACGGARGDAEAASLNVGRRRARRWRRAGGRISASMAIVLAVAVLSGNTRERGTGPVMMAEAYGQSAAVNAVNQLRQNEQRLLEAENTRHRGADGESCTTADDGGAGEHGGVDSDAAKKRALEMANDDLKKEKEAEAARLKELMAVKISQEDVATIVSEIEVEKKAAEMRLREHGGDVVAALKSYV